MKAPARHSRFATIISIGTGLLLGLAVYLIWLYAFRSPALCVLTVVLFGMFGLFLMRITAGIMGRLARTDAPRFEVAAAFSMASLLVIYLTFTLLFIGRYPCPGIMLSIVVVAFLLISLLSFLVVRRRWMILAVLTAIIVTCIIFAGVNYIQNSLQDGVSPILPHKLLPVGSGLYPFREKVTYSQLMPGISPDKKPAPFRVHYAGHTRTGLWLSMNQSLETAVVIPEEGLLRFEVGVVHPGKDLAPARILVIAKDSTGRVYRIEEFFINRQKVAWTSHEIPLSGLSPGKGIIQFQLYFTDEEHENLMPLVISNFTLFSARDRPRGHVIVVVLDALRADVLGCYGSKQAQTPVIDRLASQGILFENAITPCTLTPPVVASILTSRLPSQHGAMDHFRLTHDRSLSTLPELAAKQGVLTKAIIGNWIVYSKLSYDKGFNDFFLVPFHSMFWRGTETMMIESVHWLQAHPGDPFFLYIHNMDPHHPYLAPGPYRFGPKSMDGFQKIRAWIAFGPRIPYIYGLDLAAVDSLTECEVEELRQRYLGEVEYVDAQMAVLEGALKQSGLWEDTLLIITADHGEEFQEHGTLRHGNNLYREVIRVPLIFTGGIMQGRERRINSPVSLMDLYPTILELFDMPVPPGTLGQSLWPTIEGKAGKDRVVFSELVEPLTQRYHLMSAVKGEYHLIKKVPLLEQVTVERKLYRWDTDPEEQNDLSSYEPDLVREMEQAMDDFFENLPGKKPLDITLQDQFREIGKLLKALGYIK
jgi:arylsulfatase A-like enzyme